MFGTICDVEGDGLRAKKLHVLSLIPEGSNEVQSYYDDDVDRIFEHQVIVGHNFCRWDAPTIERIRERQFPKETTFVDTMALSWVLYPDRKNHRLEDWGEEFGIKKPEIEDWDGLTREEYTHRCEQDCRITQELWRREYTYLKKLYGSDQQIKRYVRYIQFKMYCARLAEESRWRLDDELCRDTISRLEGIRDQKVLELRTAMPSVPVTQIRKHPARPYKADGELSELGRKWRLLLESRGLPNDHEGGVEVVTGYSPPNPNSHEQLKQWLFSLGWVPRTFKTNDKGVEVPQINKSKQDGGGVCDSIKELTEDHPELSALDGLFALNHRLGILRGFLRDVDSSGFLTASVAGLTNTLRFKHAEIVNLPKPDLPYAAEVRKCLVAEDDDHELCGADCSSLEDRCKQHYVFTHDPDYVKEMMTDDFDPHLSIAETAGMMTHDEVLFYKWYQNQ